MNENTLAFSFMPANTALVTGAQASRLPQPPLHRRRQPGRLRSSQTGGAVSINNTPLRGSLLLLGGSRGSFLLLRGRFRIFPHRKVQSPLHIILDFAQHFLIVLQGLLGVLTALPEAFALVRKPGAALFHHPMLSREIQKIAFLGN